MHYDNFFYIGDLKTYDNQILLRYEIFFKIYYFLCMHTALEKLKMEKTNFSPIIIS